MDNNFFERENAEKLYSLKKNVRAASNHLGATLLGLFGIMFFWSFAFLRIASYFGLDGFSALELMDRVEISLVIQVIVSFAMMLIPTLVFCRVEKEKPSRIISFSRPEGKTGLVIIAGLAFCLLSAELTTQMGNFFSFLNYEPPQVEFENGKGVFGVILTFLSIAVTPALVEEFAMRGIVLGVFRKYGDGFAIIVSSLIFGFMHASVFQIPFAFLDGMALGYITVKSKSIWPAVIIHFLNNALSTAFDYLYGAMPEDIVGIIYMALLLALLIAFIIVVCVIGKKDPEYLKSEEDFTEVTTAKKVGWFLTSPVIIISFLVSVGIAFLLR